MIIAEALGAELLALVPLAPKRWQSYSVMLISMPTAEASTSGTIVLSGSSTCCWSPRKRCDGSPLDYNYEDPWLPDLFSCRRNLKMKRSLRLGAYRRMKKAMELKITQFEIDGSVAILTLSGHNGAARGQEECILMHMLDQADRDSEIRTVIITGAGDDFVLEQIVKLWKAI